MKEKRYRGNGNNGEIWDTKIATNGMVLGNVICSKKVFDCILTYSASPLHYSSGGVCMLKIIVKFVKGEKNKTIRIGGKRHGNCFETLGVRPAITRQVLCVSVPFQNNTHFHHIQFRPLWMESMGVWTQTMLVAWMVRGFLLGVFIWANCDYISNVWD